MHSRTGVWPRRLLLSFCFAGLSLSFASAEDYSFEEIIDPSATDGTLVWKVNNSNDVVGDYFDAAGFHGFLEVDGTFTTIDDPASLRTWVAGINDYDSIVGDSYMSDTVQGFIDTGGVFTNLNDPLATGGTHATGINDAGDVVGFYYDAVGVHGFLYASGQFQTIDEPSTFSGGTYIYGIANDGAITGSLVLGSFQSPTGYRPFYGLGGAYQTINVTQSDAGQTFGFGVNSENTVVGYYANSYENGFLDTNSQSESFDFPGATSTRVYGINDRNSIVGYFASSTGEEFGFLAIVPEPQTWMMIISGLMMTGAVVRRRYVQTLIISTIALTAPQPSRLMTASNPEDLTHF